MNTYAKKKVSEIVASFDGAEFTVYDILAKFPTNKCMPTPIEIGAYLRSIATNLGVVKTDVCKVRGFYGGYVSKWVVE